ncbi:MAG: peptide chain release factor N(5)-glutamine methyltransferase [Caulobacteraceae bacterium]
MTTLVSAWNEAKRRLEAAGVQSPAIDARILLEAAAAATRADILADPRRPLNPRQAETLDGYLARRERREPVSHILGARGFWKIMLRVTPAVLAPRPDTETILDVVLPLFAEDEAFAVLDLGVGSGAILLAILAERPRARGLGVDASDEALAVARDNAANLGLAPRAAFMHTDWTAGLDGEQFDLVVSNPPYVRTGDIASLPPEVRDHEPRLALDGGRDGLKAFRALAPQILRVLRPGGRFAVEFGPGQREAIWALFAKVGAEDLAVTRDLATHERVLGGRKKALG